MYVFIGFVHLGISGKNCESPVEHVVGLGIIGPLGNCIMLISNHLPDLALGL